MAVSFLLLGGNLGDRIGNIQQALVDIKTYAGSIILESKIYETEPWGMVHEQNFFNQVVVIETPLAPFELLQVVLDMEKRNGRVRNGMKNVPRTMDIDILFYDNLLIDEPDLIIPHPRISNRMFTLVPLAELNPTMIHPKLNKTIWQLLRECEDTSWVKVI